MMTNQWASAFVLLLCGYLRIETLGLRPLWYDELFTKEVVTQSFTLFQVWDIALKDGSEHPPLFYAICWLFSQFLPLESALRLPSAIAGVFAAYGLILWGKEIGDFRTGLIAALVFSCSSYAIDYSQEGRSYMMLAALALFLLLYFRRYCHTGGTHHLVWGSLLFLAALYTHHLSILLVPIIAAIWLRAVFQLRRSDLWIRTRQLIIAVFLLAIFYAPQFVLLRSYLELTNAEPKHTLHLSLHFLAELFGRWTSGVGILWFGVWIYGAIMMAKRRFDIFEIFACSILPILLYSSIPFSKFFDIRFLFLAFLPSLLVSALGISSLMQTIQQKAQRTSLVSLLIVILLAFLPTAQTLSTFRNFPERCHNFFYRPELLSMQDNFCERYLILNSLNSSQNYLLRSTPWQPK